MSKVGISLKIDVTKIEKARLFEGKKGKYLDATVFVDLGQADQFGNNGMITQDVSKAEKDAGTNGSILGNAKVFWQDSGQSSQSRPATGQSSQAPASSAPSDPFDSDSIPF